MKIAISSYCFHTLVRDEGLSWFDVVDKVKALGADGIEFSAFDAPPGVDKLAYAAELGAACRAAGLPVVNYAIAANFLFNTDAELDAEVNRLDGELAIARSLGAPLMRHDVLAWGAKLSGSGLSFEGAVAKIAVGVREVTRRAELMGIRTCTENHGYYMQGADRVARLFAAVNHKNYGILADVGNFICADEDGAIALGLLMPYVFHVHVKDMLYRSGMEPSPGPGWGMTRGGNFFRGAVLGQGQTPLLPALRILKNAGYDGYVSIEYEAEQHPDVGVPASLDNLRKLIGIVMAE